jgi:hypothetical protein
MYHSRFGKYLDYVDNLSSNIASKDSKKIQSDLRSITRSNLPPLEKKFIKHSIYNKLDYSKKHKLKSSFGQITPATQAATQAAVTQAAATQAAMATQAVATQAAATQAASTAAATQAAATQPMFSSQPGFSSQPMFSNPAVSGVPGVVGAIVPTGGFNDVAAAVQNLEGATQQLLQTAAGAGITGFGRRPGRFW